MQASGIGSMPGTDPEAVSRWIVDTFANDLPFVPELPERGPHAAMIGRTLSLLDLPVDILLGRWRVGAAQGIDQARAQSIFGQDLDAVEEALAGEDAVMKQQFVGPLTLAASVELRNGQSVLSDRGAFSELLEALAEVVGEQVRALNRRFGSASVIQIDEPSAPAVLAGRIATASGWGRHHSVSAEVARGAWGKITEVIAAQGSKSVLHCCHVDIPVTLARQSGFDAVSGDLALIDATDDWAMALDEGLGFWSGSTDPRAVETFVHRLGFSVESLHEQMVISPPCGLANLSGPQSRSSLEQAIAARLSLSS